jgi:hypothetical protein
MHVVVTTSLHQKGRQATSVDDFLYRGYDLSAFPDPKGTGIRGLAARFIRDGKMLARYVYLLEGGDIMNSVNIFISEEAYNEFNNDPIAIAANSMWADRDWTKTKKVDRCAALIDVGKLYKCND